MQIQEAQSNEGTPDVATRIHARFGTIKTFLKILNTLTTMYQETEEDEQKLQTARVMTYVLGVIHEIVHLWNCF